jgi:hypothetical protein
MFLCVFRIQRFFFINGKPAGGVFVGALLWVALGENLDFLAVKFDFFRWLHVFTE